MVRYMVNAMPRAQTARDAEGRTARPAMLKAFLATSALVAASLAAAPVDAQSAQRLIGCALVDGQLPEGCAHPNAGVVVAGSAPANVNHDAAGDLGDLGFSISIEAGASGSGPASAAPRHIAGTPQAADRLRAMDRDLGRLGLRVSVDRLGARPILNVATSDLRQAYRPGETVEFRASSNYPSWIARAEVLILDPARPGTPVATLPVAPNGAVRWIMPADGPAELRYVLRVTDAAGRQDITHALPLSRSATRLDGPELTGPVIAAGEAEDRTAQRRIPVRGAVVTVSGDELPPGAQLDVMGEAVIPDLRRNFVVQRILPPGAHDVTIAMDGEEQRRQVTVPSRDIFATGIVDVTLGRDRVARETWRHGRIAGFMQGVFADGTELTAMIDTREGELDELRDLLRNPLRRHPDQVLRQIQERDVWVTTGDDSMVEELAPTSGSLYLRLERDGNHLMWGDFRPESDLRRIVRTDRTLYGASLSWRDQQTTPQGEARAAISAYAAAADRLTQRDIFRGTGGSAYFLSQRDIEEGSETLIVEIRDPVSGRQISARRLQPGADYRINPVQGVVILTRPLPPTTNGPGLIPDAPLGDYQVNLVAQYDYVPSSGRVSGGIQGARSEVWVTPELRFGASVLREDSGPADHRLSGVDLLWQRSADTYLSVDIARSEGPGFGRRLSLFGGLDLDPETTDPGMLGQVAMGYRVEGRLDLAEIGGQGHVMGWYDRREAGFSSPDLTADEDRVSYGIEGRIGDETATSLSFGADRARSGAGRDERRARLGIETALRPDLRLALEYTHRRSLDPAGSRPDETGRRDNLGLRMTWTRDEDLRVWGFARATLRQSGGLERDNRLGLGAEAAISDRLRLSGEISAGTLGLAGQAALSWQQSANTSYSLGLRQDPGQGDLVGQSTGRSLTMGVQSQINERWSQTAETAWTGRARAPSMATTYGVSYSPDDRWQHDLATIFGQTREADGTRIDRQGLALGTRYSMGEAGGFRLRGEWRRDRADNPERLNDRSSWLLSGGFSQRVSEDWRLEGELNALVSRAAGTTLRDGRFIEGRLGYAYRPVASDRLHALVSYTFLEDLPGADQVNIDGDRDGPRQRSHILNAAMSYQLEPRFTLGLKYGMRYRQEAPRDSETFTTSLGHLLAARLDYHVVHRWDIMGELRAFHVPRADTTELGALLGVYREVSPNLRLGVGYAWGGVSDDLRRIRPAREGIFINLIGRF